MKLFYRQSKKNPVSLSNLLFALIAIFFPGYLSAQNLVANGEFSAGGGGWTSGCSVEVNPETVYGGSNGSNPVTEIDMERCLDQTICIFPGTTYTVSFKGTRRIATSTPATVSVTLAVRGISSGATYVSQQSDYSNTSFNFVTSSYTFSIPTGSADRQVQLHIQAINSTATYGAIVDDIQLRPQTDMSINGTSSATLNSNHSYSIENAPVSVASYNWSFGSGATPATSAAAAPTTSWTTTGPKNLTVAISNSTCAITLNKAISVTGTLPVTFTSFTGLIKNGQAVLSFSTTNEIDNNYFVIEQSADGRNYDSIARIKARNTAGTHNYSFTTPNNNNISYYRIRQVDLDNRFSFSTVVVLKNSVTGKSLTIFPTQAGSSINYAVSIARPSMATVQVFDITGKPVISKKEMFTQGENQHSLNISSLHAGLYFLKLQSMTGEATAIRQFQKM